tara:strand:- start:1229 stop:1498 length:270 start_codon:yes stop_codon:yes gene_type:complete
LRKEKNTIKLKKKKLKKKVNKKIIKFLSLIVFITLCQNTIAEEKNCTKPKDNKEKLSCKMTNLKQSKIIKKYNQINDKKTLADFFKKKD